MGNALVPQYMIEISSWMDWDDFSIDQFPRFRGVTVEKDEPRIVIRTRTGGRNREDYSDENNHLTKLDGYIKDEDDNLDCTYAYFHYKIPERSHEKWRIYVDKLKEDSE